MSCVCVCVFERKTIHEKVISYPFLYVLGDVSLIHFNVTFPNVIKRLNEKLSLFLAILISPLAFYITNFHHFSSFTRRCYFSMCSSNKTPHHTPPSSPPLSFSLSLSLIAGSAYNVTMVVAGEWVVGWWEKRRKGVVNGDWFCCCCTFISPHTATISVCII
jgi:hypothetical protein